MSLAKIARLAGVHVSTVYRLAQKLKRAPTLEEVLANKKGVGRPRKNF